VGIRYNVVRVYPLFCKTKSKTTKIFELRQISSFDLGTPYCIGNSESKNGLKGRVERIFSLHHSNCLYLMNTKWYLL